MSAVKVTQLTLQMLLRLLLSHVVLLRTVALELRQPTVGHGFSARLPDVPGNHAIFRGTSGDLASTPMNGTRSQPLLIGKMKKVASMSTDACVPQCTWQCDSPKCDQVCEPECQPPRCETRCGLGDTSSCAMKCDVPQCAVVCPRHACGATKSACESCNTQCSEPMCTLACPGVQPCRNVCEQPVCDWKCKEPTLCPKPTCRMICDTPQGCSGTSYHAELPPKDIDEVAVQSFRAPHKKNSVPTVKAAAAAVAPCAKTTKPVVAAQPAQAIPYTYGQPNGIVAPGGSAPTAPTAPTVAPQAAAAAALPTAPTVVVPTASEMAAAAATST